MQSVPNAQPPYCAGLLPNWIASSQCLAGASGSQLRVHKTVSGVSWELKMVGGLPVAAITRIEAHCFKLLHWRRFAARSGIAQI